MYKANYTVVSLIVFFAFFVKIFLIVLIGALVGTALFLSFKLVSSNSSSGSVTIGILEKLDHVILIQRLI